MPRGSRDMEWFTSIQPFAAQGSGAQATAQLFDASIHGPRFIKGATVRRMIIDMKIRATAVAQLVELFWGIVIVSNDARVAGGLPDTEDSAERPDWLVRGRLQTIQASLSDSSQWARIDLDIRTGRTLRSEEDELDLILDASTSGFILERSHFIRVLMLMP